MLGETSEKEEGETEEPETSIPEQARFDWAQVWIDEEVHLCWQRVNLRDYSPGYSLLKPLSLLFCLALYLSALPHGHILAT